MQTSVFDGPEQPLWLTLEYPNCLQQSWQLLSLMVLLQFCVATITEDFLGIIGD